MTSTIKNKVSDAQGIGEKAGEQLAPPQLWELDLEIKTKQRGVPTARERVLMDTDGGKKEVSPELVSVSVAHETKKHVLTLVQDLYTGVVCEIHGENAQENLASSGQSLEQQIAFLIARQTLSLSALVALRDIITSALLMLHCLPQSEVRTQQIEDLKTMFGMLKTSTNVLNSTQETLTQIKNNFCQQSTTLARLHDILVELGLDDSLPAEVKAKIQYALINSGNTFA